MARGGRRAGRPGARYPNRTDLALAPRTAPTVVPTGQAYGAQVDRQQMQSTVTAAAETRAVPVPPPANVPPPEAVDLNAPTRYPDRPVTGGLPVGPGAGPEALRIPANDLRSVVDAAWRETRDPAVYDLLLMLEEQGL